MEYSKTVVLNNGVVMPLVGLGTFQLFSKEALMNSIENLGYRHIDTAWLYQNEGLIGEALHEIFQKGAIKREDIFLVTKIWPSQFDNPEAAIRDSLTKLKLDFVDLYLIHWPASYFSASKKPLHLLWQQLEALVDKGLVKSLGVSNFNVQLLQDLLCYARHRPVCN